MGRISRYGAEPSEAEQSAAYVLDVRPIQSQPLHSVLERSEGTDLETSILGAERKEPCVIKLCKWTKNGGLSRKGLTKVADLSRKILKAGYRHARLCLAGI